jgi:hypothetical protein
MFTNSALNASDVQFRPYLGGLALTPLDAEDVLNGVAVARVAENVRRTPGSTNDFVTDLAVRTHSDLYADMSSQVRPLIKGQRMLSVWAADSTGEFHTTIPSTAGGSNDDIAVVFELDGLSTIDTTHHFLIEAVMFWELVGDYSGTNLTTNYSAPQALASIEDVASMHEMTVTHPGDEPTVSALERASQWLLHAGQVVENALALGETVAQTIAPLL